MAVTFRYETVSVRVDPSRNEQETAAAINAETAESPCARLVHQTPMTKPSLMSDASKTYAILLTFETEVDA